jgi:hypothetical protein
VLGQRPDSTDDSDGGATTELESATKTEFEAALDQAERHADLGLPVGSSERFRLAKRIVVKIGWPYLRRQIAFNHAIMQSNLALAERVTRLQERIERDLRNDLLDFADRSVSQAHAEIGDHVAEMRRVNADLILEVRSLLEELNTMTEAVLRTLPQERDPQNREAEHNDVEIDGSTTERRR